MNTTERLETIKELRQTLTSATLGLTENEREKIKEKLIQTIDLLI